MKFKYSAFIENTPEMREWLENIGYRKNSLVKESEFCDTIQSIVAEKGGTYLPVMMDKIIIEGTVNCLGNPQLFQAVTAIREDSDYLQWFVIDRINGATEEYVSDFRLSRKDKFDITEVPLYGIVDYHKATLTELIANFKVEH